MADSDLSSTMGSSFTGTDMSDMASPSGGGGEDVAGSGAGLSPLKKTVSRLRNALKPKDQQNDLNSTMSSGGGAPPSIYSGVGDALAKGKDNQ